MINKKKSRSIFNIHYGLFAVLFILTGCSDSTKKKKNYSIKNNSVTTQKTISHDQRLKELSKGLGKNINDMNIAELRRAKEFALLSDNKDSGIKIIDRMIIVSTDQVEIAMLHLERADLHFDIGKFQKAGKCYEEYLKMYPGSDKIDEVKYKSILCRFYQTLDIDRDQSKTKNTLALANEYLKQPDVFNAYKKDVKDIQKKCCKKLLESEIYVFNFYLKRGSTKAAQTRLDFMREHYLPSIPEVEPELLSLEIDLATKLGDIERIKNKKEELATKFNKEDTVIVAHANKPNYAKRF